MISVPRSTSARASRSSRPMTPPVGLQYKEKHLIFPVQEVQEERFVFE